MNQQEANIQFKTPMEHVLWLAKNNIPAPNLHSQDDYSEVYVEMPLGLRRKYDKWLEDNCFYTEII